MYTYITQENKHRMIVLRSNKTINNKTNESRIGFL